MMEVCQSHLVIQIITSHLLVMCQIKESPHLFDWLEAGLKIFTVKLNIQCCLPFLELSIYLFGKVQIQMAWSNGDLLSHPSKAQNQS